jgi:peptidoglycan/xylan/chitin deacetylase (PgdA/CDA1 family)
LIARVKRRCAVEAATALFRKRLVVRTPVPLISFTFDDFPRSAFLEGGAILNRHGISATYYVALGLMGTQSNLGPMFQAEDLKELRRLGHELGCHTFGHCHSWDTSPDLYEQAILRNQSALSEMIPGATFKTFAYPISWPRLAVKRIAGRHFACCRAGGRSPINLGSTDLNLLAATFLEQNRDNPKALKALIDQNARERGWLILATHDVTETPSRFGCTPDFFEQILCWAEESGARILPVVQALEVLRLSSSESTAGR